MMHTTLKKAEEFTAKLNSLGQEQLTELIRYYFEDAGYDELSALRIIADALRQKYYSKKVFFRGLIEISNYCKNDCYYCGIRKSNRDINRYRLSQEEVSDCCKIGYDLGFRTFVLQGGEDSFYSDEFLVPVISDIKNSFPDCAITISLGERSPESYQKLFEAGADRYLLRHETADDCHYGKLHPPALSLYNRKKCLYTLKEIGYQVGAGFMVGSPFQTYDNLAKDLVFLRELDPQMIGIGPFVPHKDTPFRDYSSPPLQNTLLLLSLIRIMLPKVLLPSTTALATVDNNGREKGLAAGANVVMPNLSPVIHRKDYALYDNKIYTDEEAAEGLPNLIHCIINAGFTPDFSRGDHPDWQ